MVKAAVIGGSGYTGLELLRLLAAHPRVEVVAVTSRQSLGVPVRRVFPSLTGAYDLTYVGPDDRVLDEADLAITCLPHKAAQDTVRARREAGQRVLDLSADFRFRDITAYEAHYCAHAYPEMSQTAVYGLPELYRAEIAEADLVGCPGCYPTSSLLPLAPLLKAGLIETEGLIINAASGASGAGRGASVPTLLSEAGEDFKAYKVNSHRHQPEIEQELSAAAGENVRVIFQPHLVPMSRGMLATIYARPKTTEDRIRECLTETYADSPMVHVLDPGEWPRTMAVRGSNTCQINLALDERTGTLILLSAIDNLVKGASGQVVQCLNLMAGFEETAGLPLVGLFP